jgi:hypothetical protein
MKAVKGEKNKMRKEQPTSLMLLLFNKSGCESIKRSHHQKGSTAGGG